ncbi:centrosomal protein of 19 kDa-like [Schistocerca cancellata]|uniref:centrosomal protein of 19 kDa-like n=1 Tax=Schistocerca cancellata TaxID=274614 RepID=UPI0021178EB4|nr:centrosomal protein of 19 kDa-like [Schistocerca cancellata]
MLPVEQCFPIKFGLRLSPAALLVIYEAGSGTGKIRKRIMPVRNLKPNSKISYVAKELILRHDILEKICHIKLEKMLRLLQEYIKCNDLHESLVIVRKEYDINPDEDFNALERDELIRKKEIMDEIFNKHRISPGDPGFIYDKRVDFEKGTTKVKSEWDSDGGSDDADGFWN